ncbi:unnamed protein product [Clavelina lepadiformis]|uniref:Uncharacterized protein n=1 Tax=Clavelina lepadiformis TaxID=159417 RepID=A0ABP0H008_CLALP
MLRKFAKSTLPKASTVLTSHLRQRCYPHWTSYFVKYKNVINDQKGQSHFNWEVDGHNYHILRTGCWPYIKYHCTERPLQDLSLEDKLFTLIKIVNFGIPCLAYGIGALFLINHKETVNTTSGSVFVYFLYKEDPHAKF